MPTIGLSMIVKNESHTIRACLESAREFVSQIVIADTGSSDNTCDIAREFGAEIVEFPWADHYANARNAALSQMRTDWVLVLDADEELDQATARSIPRYLKRADIGGFTTPIRNYVNARSHRGWDRVAIENDRRHPRADAAPAMFIHSNCRLFRHRSDIYFTGRIHEIVEPKITAAGLRLAPASFFIHHFGQLETSAQKAHKGAYYRHLLRLKIQDDPNDPAAWLQLGLQEYEQSKDYQKALHCLQRAVELEPRAVEAWLFLGMILVDLGKYDEALVALSHDSRTGASAALKEQVRGDALQGLRRLEEARAAYRQAVSARTGDPVLESKIGYVEIKLGNYSLGLQTLLHAAQQVPGMFSVEDRLMKAYIMLGRLNDAAEVAGRLAERASHPRIVMRAASLHAEIRNWDRCVTILERGRLQFPEAVELQQALDEARLQSSGSRS